MALHPGRAELELCAPMGGVSAAWGLTSAATECRGFKRSVKYPGRALQSHCPHRGDSL